MKEVILCKYGEIVLKGLNKSYFENMMVAELKRRLKGLGAYEVSHAQSTLYIEPSDDSFDIEGAYERAKKLFGFSTVTKAVAVEKELEAIKEAAREYIAPTLFGVPSFKVEGKRSDKRFPYNSIELSREVGGAILSVCHSLKVDLYTPSVTVRVEIRERYAYLHAGAERAAGGIPTGTGGKTLLLLSGGIDSPVAGYMLAKRGATVEAVHFDSIPYTSELAREKVLSLAKLLCEYTGRIRVHIISLTHIQEVLRDSTEEEYFTLLLRRFMMRLANRVAKEEGALSLVTGESLGQVASQTMQALYVTDSVVDMPVFRPCIGLDKEEIVRIARDIGTFEKSIEPYEDCCTVFTPRHPKTRPEPEKVLAQEAKIDVAALEEEAYATKTVEYFDIYGA